MPIRPWQALAIVAVVALGGAGGYFGYSWISGRDSSSLGANQQLVPVQKGNLTNQVSTNGSVVFPKREVLSFAAPGTVGALLVSEGDQVEEGQALASLDEATVSKLELAVAQAEVAVQEAEDRLAGAKEPADALALAQAEAAIAAAELRVKGAQRTHDAILMTPEQKRLDPAAWPAEIQALAQAESAVVTAELGLQRAQDAVDALLAPDDDARLTAATAVTAARIALNRVREALANLEALPDPAAVEKARENLATAQETYDNAVADLSTAQTQRSGSIADAELAVANARKAYSDAFSNWLGITPSASETSLEPAALLASWGADLDVIYPQNDTAYFSAVPADDPSTPWDENLVFLWSRMLPGTVVGTCDTARVPRGTMCVMQELESAWDTLEAGRETLETARSQSANALTAARNAVNKARDSLSAAQDAAEAADVPATDLELEDARQAVQVAERNLRTAQGKLAELDNPDRLAVASARADVDLARAKLAAARDALAELESPGALAVASARADLAAAEAALTDARETLERLWEVGTDERRISLAEMELRDARAALETAKDAVDGATIRAPWAGTVSAVKVEERQIVTAATGIIELVDRTIVEVAAIIDEIDVLSIAVGAQASIVMDALPGQVLPGTLVEIAEAASSQQGVVTYPVSVRIDLPAGLQLREGLSATASVIIQEERDVLLIPNQAVGGSFVQPMVRVSNAGRVTEVPVVLGISDDFWVAVRSGLAEGDLVVMETAATSAAADWRLQVQSGAGAVPFGSAGNGAPRGMEFREFRRESTR